MTTGNTNVNPAKLEGITCSVDTCAYHGANSSCHAYNIKVGTEYASNKEETFCATFQSK